MKSLKKGAVVLCNINDEYCTKFFGTIDDTLYDGGRMYKITEISVIAGSVESHLNSKKELWINDFEIIKQCS